MMLDRAMAYLNTGQLRGEADRLGGKCLIGLAAYKYNKRFGQQPDVLPALTQEGLEAALAEAEKMRGKTMEDNYSVGLALILLCEVHPQQHMPAIEAYLGQVLSRQMSHGGWGYPRQKLGDLSQLQYAVLGLWSAKNAGLQISDKHMADVMNYVIRVQDPTGAWGYQGRDPGSYAKS